MLYGLVQEKKSLKVLEVWLTTELAKIAISLQWDNTFWNKVYDQLLHIIPYSLFNMSPILYQMYGYDIVAGSMNHGLVVRSVLFGTHNRITVRASNTISKIWGSHQPDYNQYYTLPKPCLKQEDTVLNSTLLWVEVTLKLHQYFHLFAVQILFLYHKVN